MASGLGQLIVRLGLDATDFTSGMSKAEVQAQRFADSLSNKVAWGIAKAEIAMQAFEKAVHVAFEAVPELIEQAGHFQDLEEKTGGAAEAWASFAVAARIGGISMDDVAKASVKLSAGLSKIDDDTKGAGQALKAIGIDLKDFKGIDPAAQMEAIAKKLAEFEDGAGKTAVAVALFGKAGADMLPMLKELGEGVGRVNLLSREQIKLADEWSDHHAKSKALMNAYAQVIAVETVPALTALSNAMVDVVKQLAGLNGASNDLKFSHAILDWAEAAAIAIGTVVEAVAGAVKAARALAGSFESVFADIKFAAQNATPSMLAGNVVSGAFAKQLEERNQVAKQANERYVDLWNYNGTAVTDAIRKSFDEQRRVMKPGEQNGFDDGAMGKILAPKKKLSGVGLLSTDAGGNAEALLKKQLEGQLRAIRDFAEQQKAGYDFANQYLKGVYDDGLTSLADFFESQKALRAAGLQAQITALDAEIAAEEAYRAKARKPQEREDADNKIADARRKRLALIQDADRKEILSAQENERAVKALAYTYYDFLAQVKNLQGDAAGAASLRISKQVQDAQELLTKVGFDPSSAQAQAQAYGDLLTRTEALTRAQADYGRIVEVTGLREKDIALAAQLSGQSEMDTMRAIGAVRQEALGPMADAVRKAQDLAAALGTPDAQLFAAKLAQQFRQAAADAEPLLQKVRDIGREIGDSIAGKAEDALLAKGKSLRERVVGFFKGVADDVTKTMTHNLVTKPLSDYLANLLGGNGTSSGGGGILGQIFGIGSGSKAGRPMDERVPTVNEILSGGTFGTSGTSDSNGFDSGAMAKVLGLGDSATQAAQTSASTSATVAITSMGAAATAAAAALSSVAASGGASGASNLLGVGGGAGAAFSGGFGVNSAAGVNSFDDGSMAKVLGLGDSAAQGAQTAAITANSAAMSALTATVTAESAASSAASAAMTALTAAAESAAAALASVSASAGASGGGGGGGMLGGLFGSVGGGGGSSFAAGGSAGAGFGTGASFGNMDMGAFFSDGGLVKGPGTGVSDSVPANLSNGEFVVNADDTKRWLPALHAINSGKGLAGMQRMGGTTAHHDRLMSILGARANGGPVLPGGLYQVNERGPELLEDANGRQLLMMGNKRGTVKPLSATSSDGSGGGGDLHFHLSVPENASRPTAVQWGTELGRHVQNSRTRQLV